MNPANPRLILPHADVVRHATRFLVRTLDKRLSLILGDNFPANPTTVQGFLNDRARNMHYETTVAAIRRCEAHGVVFGATGFVYSGIYYEVADRSIGPDGKATVKVLPADAFAVAARL